MAKIAFGETPNDEAIKIGLHPLVNPIQLPPPAEHGEHSWIDEIKDYISNDILPLDKGKASKI